MVTDSDNFADAFTGECQPYSIYIIQFIHFDAEKPNEFSVAVLFNDFVVSNIESRIMDD